jgi:hypothetical protein
MALDLPKLGEPRRSLKHDRLVRCLTKRSLIRSLNTERLNHMVFWLHSLDLGGVSYISIIILWCDILPLF